MPASITSITEHRDVLKTKETPLLSIVIPFFNEDEVLTDCHLRITAVLDTLSEPCEIIYVDDGSNDRSWDQVINFTAQKHVVRCIKLSRNFGKEAAMTAGLVNTTGRAVVLLDADLQDPPELIPQMIHKWENGYDVVNMQRKQRHGENWLKRSTAHLFYKLINRLADIDMPRNVGDFRLLDRKVIDVINALPERNRFMKGLLSWPGFNTCTLQFDRDARQAGTTKWNYTKLIHLAFEGITSFSIRPLRIATAAGVVTSVVSLMMAIFLVSKTLFWGDPVAGYPSLMTVMLLLGGIQLLSIGLMGEYVGRLFIESKQRPNFIVMNESCTEPSVRFESHDNQSIHQSTYQTHNPNYKQG
ncbi:glycosyltransferase family 2 protein [Moritella marina ATCC 15381]|uniref:Glycosyltransferase family 2 protein n=1 Tax=Moritella marina ATCC 15381 TaxID=1202962 RepID=A0A5J6WIQ4_MORMI|nr:glycosyltransferase family 2 protein [Moritella marina]QFI37484.1 glycosyltransferase family 2 protein [Moritella marina ATCC 15381]